AVVFLPERANAINPQGLFEVDGDGIGDVFSRAQSRISRYIKTGEAQYTSLETGEVFVADDAGQLIRALPKLDGFNYKILFNANDTLVHVRVRKKKIAGRMTVVEHLNRAKAHAEKLVAVLDLEPEFADSIISSSYAHDEGKKHWLWQLGFRGTAEGEPL